jgi:phosphonate transport system substrate-binding protein
MRRPVLRSLLAAVSCTTILLATGAGGAPDSRLALAVLPCTDVEATFRKFYPLLHYLKQSAGVTVRLVVPADVGEFQAWLDHGQVDLAVQDPHTYARLARYFDASTLLWTVAPDGTTTQTGVVVVRQDSAVTEVSQLRGRKVLFGPRASTSKWVAARLLFEAAGIDVERDLHAANGGCCEDIAFAVSLRSVDAGVVCDHSLRRHEARQRGLGVDPRGLRVIARTRAFPSRLLAARRGAPGDAVGRVIAALLRLDASVTAHAGILAAAEVLGFRRVSEQEYLRPIGPVAIGRAP